MRYLVLGTGEGAKQLGKALGGECMLPPRRRVERRRLYRNNYVVNTGWSTRWAHVNPLGYSRCWVKDKARASKAMVESMLFGAVHICTEYVSYSDMQWMEIDLPMLRRKNRHSGGRDIRIVNIEEDIIPGYWYVPIFHKEREYRVHVLWGRVIKLQRKHPHDPESIVWSNESSHFERVNKDNPSYRGINDIGVRAVRALGLDMGAVDVGVRRFKKDDEECIVFEVNTAPSLNQETAERYAVAIRERRWR